MHLGVGIIIRNESGDLFFIQEKDETYPVEKYRNYCSFFGGKIEEGETPLEGLKRELIEEVDLGDLIQRIDIRFIQSFFIQKRFEFNLFEGVLSDDDFKILKHKYDTSSLPVFEGRSKILDKDLLIKEKWIWGLEEVVLFYLEKVL